MMPIDDDRRRAQRPAYPGRPASQWIDEIRARDLYLLGMRQLAA
jgi:hypothetical protein